MDLYEARHALVSAANHFLFAALPLREPDSRACLQAFVAAADRILLPTADRHAILLGILSVLNSHTAGRLPSLIDRYLSKSAGRVGRLDVFLECVEDVIRYRGIGHRAIQRAIGVIESRFSESTLTPATIAALVSLTPGALSEKFKRYTTLTPSEYLRSVRLDRAAVRLGTLGESIKEVWAAVGYNDAANFGHDFHKKFGMSPSEYRAISSTRDERQTPPPAISSESAGPTTGATVLLVDDDAVLSLTAGRLLARSGFLVLTASDGKSGLAQASSSDVDVIVLDFRLPDLDAIEFLRLLRQNRPDGKPAVAVFSADWTVEDRAAEIVSLNAGVVSKLCDFDELERVIRSYCQMPLKAA
jgi:AraC-like DNA-binding protein